MNRRLSGDPIELLRVQDAASHPTPEEDRGVSETARADIEQIEAYLRSPDFQVMKTRFR
ncbi:hypothetical protein [Roseiterribacter gracilis]|uniref:hypothetical protein n=1 Tax=Roseiterribacter gracilis TaxID=2812848 RepID=UPI003B437C50